MAVGAVPPASLAAGRLVPLASRLDQQRRLFAALFESDHRLSPLTATADGDHRFDRDLDHFSVAAAARQASADRTFLSRILAIDPSDFSEEDRTSHDLLIRVLRQRLADFNLRECEMPLNQIAGVHLALADLPKSVPLATVTDYEAYLSRLRRIPRALVETTSVLRQGRVDGLMPVRILLEKIPDQIAGTIGEDPFLEPLKSFPGTIGGPDRHRLELEVRAVVESDVLPAYRRFADFLVKDYIPYGRVTIGVSSLPGGPRRYQNAITEQTTTTLTPDEIHELGLKEVARLDALLEAIARKQGFPSAKAYRAALMAEPRFKPNSANQIVEDFGRYVTAIQPRLSEVLTHPPAAALTIEAIPPSQPSNATHYVPGTSDGARPARIVVATSDWGDRTLLNDETFAYHEGIPGHHVQISVQQGLVDLPEFRRHVFSAAYAEGWAVYAEQLAKEMGFFADPASDFGRLSTEQMRASRLVIDTGIHAQGWSREQAVAYFRSLGVADEPFIQVEVDRYIAWPAQSLSYKLGQLKILELRDRARAKLGVGFDLRAFHDQILRGGNLPLDLLEARVDGWIDRGGR